ncbi:MAG: hypothetical protein ABWY45_21255 [Mycobacterium sp.]
MQSPIIGSEALATGVLTRGQLRWNYRPIFPDVHVLKGQRLTLRIRTLGAWMWSGRRAIIAGQAAAALHGAEWVSEQAPIELVYGCGRPPAGIVARNERIEADEIVVRDGMLVTSGVRTALDLGRYLKRDAAVIHLDDLARAVEVQRDPILELAQRYSGARGVARAATAIHLMDAGSESPKESELRLILIDAGLPRPRTQIRVSEGSRVAFIDMGWDEPMVGLDYEGDHHRRERPTYVTDIGRYEMIERQGWNDLRVVAEHSPSFIVYRVIEAFGLRDWKYRRNRRRKCA